MPGDRHEDPDRPLTFDAFQASVRSSSTAPKLTPLLLALWHDARGDWDTAHHVAQDVETADGAWLHAYLHRKEGDEGNAAYWYRRAGKPVARGPLDAEWRAIVEALLMTPRASRP